MIPVYLRQLGYDKKHEAVFSSLADRATRDHPEGLTVVQPWIRWRELASYLGCVELARHNVQSLPVSLASETPSQYNSVALVLIAQALADNLAGWLAQSIPLAVGGGDRKFLSPAFRKSFTKELTRAATAFQHSTDKYLKELDRYRQVWIHQRIGGAKLFSTDVPSSPTAEKTIQVPIDPAFEMGLPNWEKKAEQIAKSNGGRYLYPVAEFADRIADGCVDLFFATASLLWITFQRDDMSGIRHP